ncbi:hypothetical protein DFQ01_12670 [Paenibacillus cellulosilyticus]|uniref:Uncharacterized protein n=1 Tax=Paenibacillus cellulosilyticus TaxID=375489 RepID=A0A2V2YMV6_9BACL|nr:DUF4097 family beta strand repeat-containing protein [Paenibacillus cellulosilyticus]PWV95599.1 hypothetical protein DFQ01_12670 [Paenibacillus cellulosilyticus]QKS47332.1 DUF4097 family beta strand repeat protein [Paenibacillus cellulosilyticus]
MSEWKRRSFGYAMRRWAAVFSSCLLPGAGHFIMGRHARGLLLMAIAVLDAAMIVRLADAAGGKHLLLIVYLGIVLPVLYFYGVFDILQTTGMNHTGDRSVQSRDSGPNDDDSSYRQRVRNAIGIVAAGLLLTSLLVTPDKLRPALDEIGGFGAPILLFAVAGWILVRKRSNGPRLGRWTAAIATFATGGLLLFDEWTGQERIALLGTWWPVLFVLIGIELLVHTLRRKKPLPRLSADASGIIWASVIAITAYSVTQYAELPYRWLDQWAAQRNGYTNFGEEKGFNYTKPDITADRVDDMKRITIDNPNGNVRLLRGTEEQIIVKSTVWIDSGDKETADHAAEQTNVELTVGEETTIVTKSVGFGDKGDRQPRVNVIVYLPPSLADAPVPPPVDTTQPPTSDDGSSAGADTGINVDTDQAASTDPVDTVADTEGPVSQEAATGSKEAASTDTAIQTDEDDANDSAESDEPSATTDDTEPSQDEEPVIPPLDVHVSIQLGDADISSITNPIGLSVEVGDGRIKTSDITGNVTVKTVNGSIELARINGDVAASVSNGSIDVKTASGNVTASTANGGIHLNDVAHDVEVDTKNGEITIHEAGGQVKADTLNGSIEVISATVGGDWDIVGLVGDIRLKLPIEADYELNGSVTFGTIDSKPELPLTTTKKTVRGIAGSGEHRIYINANNSISIAPY